MVVLAPSPPLLYTPSVDVQASIEERRSFHYFRSRNMSELPGNFEPYFWDHVVLQFSHRYPTILQALIALSAVYEEHDQVVLRPTQPSSEKEYALQQYNIAVNNLVEYLASENQDPRVALTACLIFVWIEFVQNNITSGFQQLDCGLKILRDLRLASSSQDGDSEDILGSLDRSFTRLRIQAAVHGAGQSDFTTSTTRELEVLETIPSNFASIFESRSFLDKELNAIFGYMRLLFETGYDLPHDMILFVEVRNAHLDRLEHWYSATRLLMGEQKDQSHSSGILYLQLYYTFMKIIWTAMLSTSELIYDACTADFEQMLALASRLLDDQRSTKAPVLSFDMNVIPPLFTICLKCRILRLRKQAIALLKRAPEREGLWHRDSIIEYCEWKVSKEEEWRGGLAEDEPLPEFARIYAEHVPKKGDSSFLNAPGQPVYLTFRRGPMGCYVEETVEIPNCSEMLRHMGNMV